MSVCLGIDVHRKRSQVAVVNEGGEVLANRNVPNGAKPILPVIGGLPAGTPAAYEAALCWERSAVSAAHRAAAQASRTSGRPCGATPSRPPLSW